MICYSFIIT
jgi:hypothetical protein